MGKVINYYFLEFISFYRWKVYRLKVIDFIIILLFINKYFEYFDKLWIMCVM